MGLNAMLTVMEPPDVLLLQALENGLPLVAEPYAALARQLGMNESEVVTRIDRLRACGIIKRFGVVVRHHELGYRANGMVVWDIPDEQVPDVGRRLGAIPFVTLCYRRPRRLPDWPYNLFTMIHGQDRQRVLDSVQSLVRQVGLNDIRHEVLFSCRRFKQRGARYSVPSPQPSAALLASRSS